MKKMMASTLFALTTLTASAGGAWQDKDSQWATESWGKYTPTPAEEYKRRYQEQLDRVIGPPKEYDPREYYINPCLGITRNAAARRDCLAVEQSNPYR